MLSLWGEMHLSLNLFFCVCDYLFAISYLHLQIYHSSSGGKPALRTTKHLFFRLQLSNVQPLSLINIALSEPSNDLMAEMEGDAGPTRRGEAYN